MADTKITETVPREEIKALFEKILSNEDIRLIKSALKIACETVEAENDRVANLSFPHNRPIGFARPILWREILRRLQNV